MPIRLIVGIANNPNILMSGPARNARDNVGAAWIFRLCRKYDLQLKEFQTRESSLSATRMHIAQTDFHCAITSTHYSNAGENVYELRKALGIQIPEILVVCDDLFLEPGEVRFKLGGSVNTSHKGIIDIAEKLNSRDFHRLIIGIGHPGQGEIVNNYLTAGPSVDDQASIDKAMEHSYLLLPAILNGDWQLAMGALNPRRLRFRP